MYMHMTLYMMIFDVKHMTVRCCFSKVKHFKVLLLVLHFVKGRKKGRKIISVLLPTNKNNVMSLIQFSLFISLLQNHRICVYAFTNYSHNKLSSRTAEHRKVNFRNFINSYNQVSTKWSLLLPENVLRQSLVYSDVIVSYKCDCKMRIKDITIIISLYFTFCNLNDGYYC